MKYTFKFRQNKKIKYDTEISLDIFMDGIPESIGSAHFDAFTDMGECFKMYNLIADQGSSNRYKKDYIYNKNLSAEEIGSSKKINTYPSRDGGSKFYDFGTIIVFDEIYFKADANSSRFGHLPVPESKPEYWDLVKQSLLFMIQHTDATTLGWKLSFSEYNEIPMMRWLRDEGFERLVVENDKYIIAKNRFDSTPDQTQLLILK